MNKQSTKIFIISVLILSMINSGCLKDKDYENGLIQSTHSLTAVPKIIEIKTNATNTNNFYVVAFPNSNNDTTINYIPVNLATSDPATEDIHVTLMQNDQIVTNYNNDPNNSSVYQVPSSSLVTILNPGNLVVIPKGQHTGYLKVKFKPSNLIGTLYAMGFSIKSVQEPGYVISGNASNGMGALIAKNDYDGTYITKGYFIHPSLGSSWTQDDNVQQVLYTTGATSVEGNPLKTLASDIGAALDITVNPDNTLNISLRGNPTPFDPQNRYDPATRTFYVKGGYGTRKLVDTLTYLHP